MAKSAKILFLLIVALIAIVAFAWRFISTQKSFYDADVPALNQGQRAAAGQATSTAEQ